MSNPDALNNLALVRQLRKNTDIRGMSEEDIQKAFFNLETHKIELEMQTEELLRLHQQVLIVNDEYTELYENAPVGYLTLNIKGFISKCNETSVNILGIEYDSLINKKFANQIASVGQDKFFKCFRALLRHQKMSHCDLPIVLPNGDRHWISIDAAYVTNQSNKNDEIRLIISDIDSRVKNEEERRKLACAVEYSSSAVYITDLQGNIEYVNPKFCEITGYDKDEAIGETPRLLKSDDTPKETHDELWKSIVIGTPWSGEFHNRKKDGTLYRARTFISFAKDELGEVSHYVAIQNDVSKEYELNELLNYQARYDALTGLINRAEFERRLKRLLKENSSSLSLNVFCYMDLDHFKIINDTCGHNAGDELLRQVSTLMQGAVRQRDTLARLGGDEFGLLMEHCTLKEAKEVMHGLLASIDKLNFMWDGHAFQIGISIGLVTIEPGLTSLEECLKQADAACYVAKRMGRNRIHLYSLNDNDLAIRYGEMQWLSRINKAFNENQFRIYAQSINALNDDFSATHYEMLLRLEDDNGDMISPEAFLPSAERYGLMEKIDSFVIKSVFTSLKTRPAFLSSVDCISINLSGASLANPKFLDFIHDAIMQTEIEANKICFEITETAAISNMTAAIDLVNSLKSIGCRFALDDFGTGLSSFSYLKMLPVDYLKIDGMFIRNIANDKLNKAMVKSINEIAHVMKIKTVAEFVEDSTSLDLLTEFGVDFAQGFYLGQPMLLEDLILQAEQPN